VNASSRSIGPRRDKGIVFNILATTPIAPDEPDLTGVALGACDSVELTSAVLVAIQAGTASVCGVCAIRWEQGRKKERSGNETQFRHKRLRGLVHD